MISRWKAKFSNAFRGIRAGTAGQSSFAVHLPCAALVLLAAALLGCTALQWALLLLCITLVLSLELMNSAIESLARGLCSEQNTDVGKALDIASGAVLVGSIGAAVIGLSVFIPIVLNRLSP